MKERRQPDLSANAAQAAALVKATAEATATALNIQYIQRDITEIKQSIKDISGRDENFVLKEDFIFWRNLLVSGMLLAIFLGILMRFIK